MINNFEDLKNCLSDITDFMEKTIKDEQNEEKTLVSIKDFRKDHPCIGIELYNGMRYIITDTCDILSENALLYTTSHSKNDIWNQNKRLEFFNFAEDMFRWLAGENK